MQAFLPAPERKRQEDLCKFEASLPTTSLCTVVSCRTVEAMYRDPSCPREPGSGHAEST